MKICPKCKNEYREGITHCADCHCELVEAESLENERQIVAFAPFPVILKAKEYLEYCGYSDLELGEPDEKGMVYLYCQQKDYKKALQEANVFMQEEANKVMKAKMASMSEEEIEAAQKERVAQVPPSNVYQNFETKAYENKSSAICFLVMGAIGVAIVALSWFGMLPFTIGGEGNWFTHGILLAFFIFFIAVGIISAKNVGKYKALAVKESGNKSELESYLEEKFTVDVLGTICAETEEEAYFKRMAYMRQVVAKDWADANYNQTFMESLLDAHYDKLFG